MVLADDVGADGLPLGDSPMRRERIMTAETCAEAIVAAALGIEFAAVSLVTNPAAGLSDTPIRHEDVTEAAARAARGFGDLLERFVARL